jgi:hypothetical protein
MNYSIFSFKATVDFFEVEIHTATRALASKMEKKLRLGGVTAIDAGAGNYATAFKIKLHDLRRFVDLKAAITRIESAYPLSRPPVVTMIEVAFDAYLKDGQNGTADDLAMLAARMAHFAANPADPENIRLYHHRKLGVEFEMPFTVEAMARKMADGWNYASGNNYHEETGTQQDDWTDHAYLKRTDRRQQLPEEDHRARYETRKGGAALPYRNIEAWRDFRFESLASCFSWRKEHDSGTAKPMQQVLMGRPGASHRKDYKRHKGTAGGKGGGTVAYLLRADPLNRIAEKRLQNLTRSWQRGEK